MTGWQRIKLVATVIWWGMFATLVLYAHDVNLGEVFLFFAVAYALVAAVWWAFAGFSNRR